MSDEVLELPDVDPEYFTRFFYGTLCKSDPSRVDRLMNPMTADDHLLRIQADPLLNHTRFFRVARGRAMARDTDDYLEPCFQQDFDDYLAEMTEDGRMIAECIPHRYVLTNNREAMCLETDGGRVIIVAEALRYALYFMNLASGELYGLPDVPPDVEQHAMLIAARTMLMTESLDFDLDPRGIIPSEIEAWLDHMTAWQMKFIIGHEFAHHRLGHKGLGLYMVRPITNDPGNGIAHEWRSHRRSWDEEYEADAGAITEVEDETARKYLTMAAALFFLYLEFFERVEAGLDPSLAQIDTHPPTVERLRRIVTEFGDLIDANEEWMNASLNRVRQYADYLLKAHKNQERLLTFYGSIYLASWRGPVLVDRVDY